MNIRQELIDRLQTYLDEHNKRKAERGIEHKTSIDFLANVVFSAGMDQLESGNLGPY